MEITPHVKISYQNSFELKERSW